MVLRAVSARRRAPCYLCLTLLAGAAFAEISFPTNEVPGDLLIDIGTMDAKQDQGYGWSLAASSWLVRVCY